jgi:hypothetical protein
MAGVAGRRSNRDGDGGGMVTPKKMAVIAAIHIRVAKIQMNSWQRSTTR